MPGRNASKDKSSRDTCHPNAQLVYDDYRSVGAGSFIQGHQVAWVCPSYLGLEVFRL